MAAKIGTPRVRLPAARTAGETIEIRTLVSHPMETGLRRDQAGELIPRDMIRRFEVRFEGELVFAVDLATAISANPYLAFPWVATRPGRFEFTWISDAGERASTTAELRIG